jgi:hypothetical protein
MIPSWLPTSSTVSLWTLHSRTRFLCFGRPMDATRPGLPTGHSSLALTLVSRPTKSRGLTPSLNAPCFLGSFSMRKFSPLIDSHPGDGLTTPSASFVYVLWRRPATFVRIAPSLLWYGIWCMHGFSIHALRLSPWDCMRL